MPEVRDYDVVVVGGGIAGPAVACALAGRAARVLLVERSAEALDTARGDHLQPHSCEWLDSWGALDEMWLRGAEKRLGARYLDPDGSLVLHVPVDPLNVPNPYFVYLNHEQISEALLAAAAANPGFECRRPATALPVRQGDRWAVEVRDGDGAFEARTRLLVAADGRTSRLRRAAGIEAETYAYRNPMLTMFARRTIDDPRNEVRAYFTPGGVLSVIPRTGGDWKIGMPVPPAELADWKRAGAEGIGQRLAGWVPELAGVRPEVSGVYPVTRSTAARWSDANLVLIGDACNTLHPGRSQGMNVALRAAFHLRSALDAHDGLADDEALRASLEAFEAELRPVMDARLEENHRRGLEMDRLDPQDTAALRERLAAVASDPERHAAYCRSAAGY